MSLSEHYAKPRTSKIGVYSQMGIYSSWLIWEEGWNDATGDGRLATCLVVTGRKVMAATPRGRPWACGWVPDGWKGVLAEGRWLA